jgi:hypothetical protein
VKILKQKIIKTIYIDTETSFVNGASSRKMAKRSTRDLVVMLRGLGEQVDSIHEYLLKSRAKFLKD